MLTAVIVGTMFVISILFIILQIARDRRAWTAPVLVIIGIAISLFLENLMSLHTWIALGLTFTDLGATTLTIGILASTAVMTWNFIATRGRELVR